MLSLIRIFSQIEIERDKLKIPGGDPSSTTVSEVLSLVFALLGAVAFLMIVLSGLRYTLSRGDSDKIAKAKNSIIYSAIGLILATLAFSIVRFVVRSV
jgi:hypothetical protein